ncbi:MAG: sodium:calcium antiporter [Candidatus Gracilibacteria bacterium]
MPEVLQDIEYELVHKKHAHFKDIGIIIGGALAIFLSGHILVEEVVYFSEYFGVPSSIIALLVLSIGTNIPEIVIAVRSMRKHRADIAFGDYMGSSVANTLLFGALSLLNGTFIVESSEFITTALFTILSFSLLFLFAQSAQCLSRKEGFGLLGIYALFVLSQAGLFIYFIVQ